MHKSLLPNDIRVLSQRIPWVRSISLGVWVDVGSRDDPPKLAGISHFIEHMLFKGTKRRSDEEIAKSLESVGGQLNAFTSRENTCYLAKVLDENLKLALDVLSDLIQNSIFAPDHIEKEREVVLEEIKDMEDYPSELVVDNFIKLLWNGHPMGRFILGSSETVSSLTRKDLIEFMDENYIPGKLVVVAAGNLRHEDLLSLVEESFHLSASPLPPRGDPPTFSPKRLEVTERDTSLTHMVLGIPAFPFSDPRRYPLLFLNNILGDGMGSRLFQTVRQKNGLAYSIYSFLDFFRDTGIFGIYLGANHQKAKEALKLVLSELEGVSSKGITDKEFAYAKSRLKGALVFSQESTTARMERLAQLEFFLGRYLSLSRTLKEVDEVDKDEVSSLAREYLTPSRFSLSVLGPDSSGGEWEKDLL